MPVTMKATDLAHGYRFGAMPIQSKKDWPALESLIRIAGWCADGLPPKLLLQTAEFIDHTGFHDPKNELLLSGPLDSEASLHSFWDACRSGRGPEALLIAQLSQGDAVSHYFWFEGLRPRDMKVGWNSGEQELTMMLLRFHYTYSRIFT